MSTNTLHGEAENGAEEKLSNPSRGCGTLDRGSAYIRGVGADGTGGILPSFVKLDPPLPYREIGTDGSFTRGYEHIDGLTMQIAIENSDELASTFEPLGPPGTPYEIAFEKMWESGMYGSQIEIPDDEHQRHCDRIAERGTSGGAHWGEIDACGQQDLLMRAGATYYPDPDGFIEECREHGLSKKIPVGPGNVPDVVPGVTRCWILHPNALPDTEFGAGIIGYAYIGKPVFTEPEEGDLPEYVTNLESQGRLEVKDIEDPPEVEQEDPNQAGFEDFESDESGSDIEIRSDDGSPWATVTDGDDGIRVNGRENAEAVKRVWENEGVDAARGRPETPGDSAGGNGGGD
jgi:hypothetical protein